MRAIVFYCNLLTFDRITTTTGAPRNTWKASDLDDFYIENVQGGQPYITEMHDIMLRLLRANQSEKGNNAFSFLDLGCGNGFLSKSILREFPGATGTLVDFSERMLDIAKNTLTSKSLQFVQADLSGDDWVEKMKSSPFDAIVTAFAIHNFRTTDQSKREFNEQIFGLLRPGGLFVNLELVSVSSGWLDSIARSLSEDSVNEFHRRKGSSMTGKQVMEEYGRLEGRKKVDPSHYVPSHNSVGDQIDWLRSCGFQDVDCCFRVFRRALFCGRRP